MHTCPRDSEDGLFLFEYVNNAATIKRGLIWSVCLYLALLSFAASAWADAKPDEARQVILSESERAWIRHHPVVRWGVDPQWPPFSSLDEQGRISGIDVDLVKLIAKRIGLETKFIPTRNWSETLLKSSTGEIDFVAGIARTDERERLHGLRFTEVYCRFPTAIVTRKDMPFLTPMVELGSRRIALPRNYATTEELLRRYPRANLQLTEDEEQSMLDVAGNRADATALNLASACYIVHMHGLSDLKISGFTEADFFLSFAVNKEDSPELRSILQKGLDSVSSNEKEEIYAGYIIPETLNEIDWKTWRRRLIYSAIVGTSVLAAALLWNRILAGEIRRRKVAEASLLQAKHSLEEHGRQLDSHARKLDSVNRSLTLANQDLEAFSYSVSHDLKGPLRRMRSFADMLQFDAGEKLDSTTLQCLKAIQQESKRMDDLINALLALARVSRAQLHLMPVNLDELTREVIQDLEVDIQGREIHWEILHLSNAKCDRGLIEQVLVNLLSNAVKFTRGRTPAVIEIGELPEEHTNHEQVFFVKDNGAGFENKQAGTLFEAFHRLHRHDEYEGSGIGLSNVKRIIQKHGGRVWAEGEVGVGATFYFSLMKDSAAMVLEPSGDSDGGALLAGSVHSD